jgi:hypothetical protein
MNEHKQCSTCKEQKELSLFNKASTNKDGLSYSCKDCLKKHKKKYRENNKAKIVQDRKKYKAENKAKVLAAKKRYRQKYKVRHSIQKSVRERNIRLATPSWASYDEMALFYEAARAFRTYTGKEYHVDHIVPLKSPKVCGLNCEANLQVLEAFDNLSKSNKHWPNMP